MSIDLLQAAQNAFTAAGLLRTMDATVINRIINDDPEIAAAVFHDPSLGPIDFQPLLGKVASTILLDNGRDAAGIFEWSSPNVWQAHSVFARSCRGKDAIAFGKAMLREMFDEWGAEEVWGMTPIDNRAAQMFNRKCGAKYSGTTEHHTTGTGLLFRVRADEWNG